MDLDFCPSCGAKRINQAAYCHGCGASFTPAAPAQPSFPTGSPVQPPTQGSSNTYSNIAIALGGIAFLLLPIVLGPAGIICSAMAMSKNEPRGKVALAVSICGTFVGMFLGALAVTALSH